MPTQCTVACFGFRARRIDGVECGLDGVECGLDGVECGLDGVKCGLFSNHAPLGQTTLRVG